MIDQERDEELKKHTNNRMPNNTNNNNNDNHNNNNNNNNNFSLLISNLFKVINVSFSTKTVTAEKFKSLQLKQKKTKEMTYCALRLPSCVIVYRTFMSEMSKPNKLAATFNK